MQKFSAALSMGRHSAVRNQRQAACRSTNAPNKSPIQKSRQRTCTEKTRAAAPDCLTARATISEPLTDRRTAWALPARASGARKSFPPTLTLQSYIRRSSVGFPGTRATKEAGHILHPSSLVRKRTRFQDNSTNFSSTAATGCKPSRGGLLQARTSQGSAGTGSQGFVPR